ncbi:MAG: lipid-A-disaccharide synthase [Chitinophagales bacterium]|nr:lipid-A-disaccharide synthase [Chitinophagales bacterium]MDW8274320.1 lipid-A-disaccharide synthase [Chitinophagales bacterium]
MKYYIVAGESSGDLHGSLLIKELSVKDPHACFRVWGGDKMQQAGAEVVKHIKELSFMGFWEVAANLLTILRQMRFCKEDILRWKPDVVVLIDYPGFNLRLLPFLKQNNFKTVWYIAPQVWAWKSGRTRLLKRYVDKLLVIFPFEVDYFKRWGIEAIFTGHPLVDLLPPSSAQKKSKLIALLPGSRKQEIKNMLPEFMKVCSFFPEYEFWVAGMSLHGEAFYQKFITAKNCRLFIDDTYFVLSSAEAALVTSGTATIEAALLNTPQVVCYKGNPISYWIGRLLVKVPYISMVNLVCAKKVVDELIQHDLCAEKLVEALKKTLMPYVREQMLKNYAELRNKLGDGGASSRAAVAVYELAKSK